VQAYAGDRLGRCWTRPGTIRRNDHVQFGVVAFAAAMPIRRYEIGLRRQCRQPTDQDDVGDLDLEDETEGVRCSSHHHRTNPDLLRYLPKDQYMVCLTGDQLGQIQAQNIGVTPLHLDRRLSPGLSGDSATPGTQLIAELCDNDDRDLADLVQRLRPQLADLQVALDPVSAKRLKITLNGNAQVVPAPVPLSDSLGWAGTTPPVQVARSLIDLLCEIVWVEPKGRIVLH
ncbi:hypothetical protein BVRB_024950, partial [Beta vulgaris subsp. vulgaris]